ncbi:NERD domain-containing protein [Pyxidicoccus fallax]|uniref:NERD domain-containing protein n=2 Tax=Pyxidicoccus fallax TaxID=394095 RepID=A0A848LZB6_9BACT|nr:nuclease-related domain-containing protein [Pyxidicoccus fallax]NMO23196.1 NERD domain-containing protein [Pyxidicoccus fallax]NPC87045.1 NERD domain-containing protein [Pyxidicoccus fallax]
MMRRDTGRRPGQSARERQQALASADPVMTVLARQLGINTAEQAWDAGARGEQHVGRLLNPLRADGWFVMHDLKVSRGGTNVDHLAIGPSGVFVIDTKNVQGSVWVGGPNIKVNGFSKDYVEKLEAQALLVRQALLEETDWDSLWVQGLLVFVKPDLHVKEQPENIVVLDDSELLPVLVNGNRRLSTAQVERLARAAQAIWR